MVVGFACWIGSDLRTWRGWIWIGVREAVVVVVRAGCGGGAGGRRHWALRRAEVGMSWRWYGNSMKIDGSLVFSTASTPILATNGETGYS